VVPGIILAVTEESAMASSPEILAAPHEVPAGPGQREHWADDLRVPVIAVVVVWHTAVAYLGGTHWYYMDRATSKVWSTVALPAWIIAFRGVCSRRQLRAGGPGPR
jgi:hypothetical protein